ncbi:MAG: hypothetical protein JNK23_13340 [Opitutaceae bacterium]|nr:hypothetical protein [Opitutaceae bacterium]
MSHAIVPAEISRRAFLTQLAAAPLAAAQASSIRPPLIDTHVHVWSDDSAAFPFAHPSNPNFRPPAVAATAEALLAEMDRHGISHAVLVQVIYYGWDNRYLARCVKEHPRRFRAQGLKRSSGATRPRSGGSVERRAGRRRSARGRGVFDCHRERGAAGRGDPAPRQARGRELVERLECFVAARVAVSPLRNPG